MYQFRKKLYLLSYRTRGEYKQLHGQQHEETYSKYSLHRKSKIELKNSQHILYSEIDE